MNATSMVSWLMTSRFSKRVATARNRRCGSHDLVAASDLHRHGWTAARLAQTEPSLLTAGRCRLLPDRTATGQASLIVLMARCAG
jgi:hypothetical protein